SEGGMTFRWLAPLGVALALAALARGDPPAYAPGQAGYLVVPVEEAHGFHLEVIPYYPRPGDVLLYDDGNPWYHLGYHAIGTGEPTHVAITFDREDHSPAILDLVGPTVRGAKVSLLEVAPRLLGYPGA